jgi:membrane protein
LEPIIVLAIAVANFFFGSEAVTGQVAGSIKDLLGDRGAKAVQAMLADAGRPREGTIASLLCLGARPSRLLVLSFRLKDALDTAWEVPRGQTTKII